LEKGESEGERVWVVAGNGGHRERNCRTTYNAVVVEAGGDQQQGYRLPGSIHMYEGNDQKPRTGIHDLLPRSYYSWMYSWKGKNA